MGWSVGVGGVKLVRRCDVGEKGWCVYRSGDNNGGGRVGKAGVDLVDVLNFIVNMGYH